MITGDVHNAAVGFAIFDSWLRAVEKAHHAKNADGSSNIASPAVDAAFQAFNAYASTMETMNNAAVGAMASQLTGYAPNATGGVSTTQQLAPFYALNLLA